MSKIQIKKVKADYTLGERHATHWKAEVDYGWGNVFEIVLPAVATFPEDPRDAIEGLETLADALLEFAAEWRGKLGLPVRPSP